MDTPMYAIPTTGRRVLARVADILTVVVWVWALSVAHVLLHLTRWSDSITPEPWGGTFLFALTVAAVSIGYEVAFVSRTGSTPGKDLMRLKVLDAHTGERPTVAQATRRALPFALVWLIPPTWLVIPATAALGATGLADRRGGRTVHDLFASTRVVHQLELEVEPGRTVEEAEAERRRGFTPRFVDPIQLLPTQIFRHPGAPRPGGPGIADQGPEPPTR